MKIEPGLKVKNQYGRQLTIFEIISLSRITVVEEFNNWYHPDKLFYQGKPLSTWMNGNV